jgi:hypothetical protein
MNEELKPCPFCEGIPSFSNYTYEDDRRYIEMKLSCDCGVTFTYDLCYMSYVKLSDNERIEILENTLREQWNKRPDELKKKILIAIEELFEDNEIYVYPEEPEQQLRSKRQVINAIKKQ